MARRVARTRAEATRPPRPMDGPGGACAADRGAEATAPAGREPDALGDLRFRALLGAGDWAALPRAVRRRFSKRLRGGATTVYAGHVTRMERNRAGAILAHALRPLGAPLPLSRDTGAPSVITVTEDVAGDGQNWTRIYARRSGFPQIVHSSKRFCGPTGLEEHLGHGLSMALAVAVEDGALVFRSAGYALDLGRLRLALPRALWPGRLTVRHEDRGGGAFAFSLTLDHPLLGRLLHQAGLYRDTPT